MLLAIMEISAQPSSIFGTQDFYDILFRQSVKSCDEFMCRFNEEEYFPDLKKDDPQLGQKNFLFLFDYELANGKDRNVFLKSIYSFYDAVKANHAKLKYESKNWYAEQRLSFLYKKKSVEISLIFQTEESVKKLPSWTIVGVKGMEKVGFDNSDKRMSISPEQNEAEFMELESIFKFNSKSVSQFRSNKLQLDALSYFFALVESGALTFEGRISTSYHFFDVPSYMFTVSFYSRKKSNSGWLISDFKKVNQEEKKTIIYKLLGK